jgi:ABC-2 type transport system ATP-binding protein
VDNCTLRTGDCNGEEVVTLIVIRNLSKSFRRANNFAVADFSLSIDNGEIVGLIGINGAGKTTIMRLAAGVIAPTSGNISIDGYNVRTEKVKASRSLGWVPETPNFDPSLRPTDLMVYFGGFYGMSGKEARERGNVLLEQVGLGKQKNKRIKAFSQGMKKRFALAVSMLNDPMNYLFDETFNGLDPEGVRTLRHLILDLKLRKRAILFSSHILTEIENIADRVAIIDKGSLIDVISRDQLDLIKKKGGNLEDYFFSFIDVKSE